MIMHEIGLTTVHRPQWLGPLQSLLEAQPVSVEPHGLAALIERAIPQEHRRKIVRNLDPAVEAMMCAPGPLEVALACLIQNAIDASADCSEDIVVTTSATSEAVRIEVADKGPGFGMPIGFAIQSGTGLTIARTIAERHGGQLWLENAACGVKAIIELPHRVPTVPTES